MADQGEVLIAASCKPLTGLALATFCPCTFCWQAVGLHLRCLTAPNQQLQGIDQAVWLGAKSCHQPLLECCRLQNQIFKLLHDGSLILQM